MLNELDIGKRLTFIIVRLFASSRRSNRPIDISRHVGQTGDKEWYDPEAIVTEGGNLVITLSQEPWRDLNFRSG